MNFIKTRKIPALLIVMFLILGTAIFYSAHPVFCQEENSTSSNHEGLLRSLQDAHKSLLSDIETLRKRVSEAEAQEKKSFPLIENLQLKRATYSSPLLASEPDVEELRQAKAGVFNDIKEINRQVDYLNKLFEEVKNAEAESLERTALYNDQITRLKEETQNLSDAQAVLAKLRQIIDALNLQRKLLSRLQAIFSGRIKEYKDLLESYQTLYAKLEGALDKQEKSELTRKSSSAFTDFNWSRIRFEAERGIAKTRSIFTKQFWLEEGRNVSEFNLYLLGSFLAMLLIALSLLRRLRRFCAALRQKPALQRYPWLCLTLEIIRRSVLLLGTVIFLYVYGEARQLYSLLPIYPYVVDVLLAWLFTSWALNFLKLSYEAKGLSPGKLFHRLRIAIYVVRFFVISYSALDWAIDTESWILALWRVLFSATLFLLSLRIAKLIWNGPPDENSTDARLPETVKKIIIGAMYVMAGGGLFIELAGYGNFTLFWLASWGRLLIVLLWGGLIFVILRRLDHDGEGEQVAEEAKAKRISKPVRWLLIRVGQLSWILAMCVGVLVAWGAGGPLIIHFFNFLNRPFEIGSLRLSLQSVGYALLILLITHALTSLWRPFFYNKILDRSGMERGMQASITTISIYVIWFLGILIALNTIGVSATSLAVLFGALGIGLGFGLQNIFSNFVSGLILLFERPVQVGDAVEIDGTWGLIQNINVRATVVQTYDNASLIIPNSDFISKQVTNWSFKDPRVRINVEVGVAYGSDAQLVKDTLLEVAKNNPRVMEHPQPDVLFTDFGDSALMFKLRVWTYLNFMLSTGTDLRFEIDRLFRERGVEIPFPQRDIHVRSMVEKPKAEPQDKEE